MTQGTTVTRIAELEQDNARLRRLLTRSDAPGELRHRLLNTIGLLRAIIRKSADSQRDRADYVAQLEDRLDAVTRAQAAADRYGEVGLQVLLADELLRYGLTEGGALLLSGPEVWFQPRAGQVLALAVHELAVNAVEHGMAGVDGGLVEVVWTVAGPDAPLVLSWKETGKKPGAGLLRKGFGHEVLTRMLPYELDAETNLAIGPDGLRCTMRIPLTERVGRVAAAKADAG